MATFNPRRFAQPDRLKEIAHSRLALFLHPFRDYLEGRGMTFPTNGGGINYALLASILINPDDQTPNEMVDALYFVHEMATPEGMNQLLDAALEKDLALDHDPDSSPADIAVQVWLLDRALLETLHAKGLITHPRSFIYFSSRFKKRKFVMPTEDTIQALENDMDTWFEEHRRGRSCKIAIFDQGQKVGVLIRHGRPTKREGAVKEGGEPSSIHYRPEKHDVVVYDQNANELAVNADTKGEREMYVAKIGLHFFGDEFYFPGGEKYTLEPLKMDGRAALVCSDVEGMEWIRLRLLDIQRGGQHGLIDTRKASDLFSAMDERGEKLSIATRLARATFEVKFAHAKRPRSVTLRPANNAQFARDEDSNILEEWMGMRGFFPGIGGNSENEENKSILANSGMPARPVDRHGGMAVPAGG